MKKPRTPPKVSGIKNASKFQKAISAARDLENKKKYRHWDTLRHLSPPEGLTLEEWWTGIKIHRMGGRKEISLKDVKGRLFNYTMTDFVTEQLHKIDLGSGGSIGIPEPIMNPQTRNQYLARSLMQEAITSSQLEGAVTVRAAAKAMLRTGRPPRDKNEQMVLNNYQMMQRIQKWKDQPLTESLIFEMHRQVTEKTLEKEDAAGRLRKKEEKVVIEDVSTHEILHAPPPASQLRKRLEAMCDFANGKTPEYFVHPVVRAIILHFWLAYDHPFVDGNGRTARALFYWSMLRQGYWLFEFISISEVILRAPSKYAVSFLQTETDDNDLTYFIIYQSKVIERSLAALNQYITHKTEQLAKVTHLFRSGELFNHRQSALLAYALRFPRQPFTIDTHKNYHHIAYETARHDLRQLEKRGYLIERRIGNSLIFVSPDNLEAILTNEEKKR
ncbi:MAG: Fic family protein [Simkania sp.]|nr:Fic family protein [Simkania sp.]MCP5490312.1 Fic family protein [Chlamydiales bacterium]